MKEYEIKTIDDFLKVPADRIDDCLAEFKTWYEVTQPLESLIIEVSKTLNGGAVEMKFNRGFTWIDDGNKNIGIKLHDVKVML